MAFVKQIILVVGLLVTVSYGEDLVVNDFCRNRIGQFAHPTICYRWVQCLFFGGVINECGEGQIFAQDEGCVTGDRNTCQREVPVPTVPTFPTDEPQQVCQGVSVGIRADPERCYGFIVCVMEEPERFLCPQDRPIFVEEINDCVPGNRDTCEIFGPTSPTTTTPVQTPPTSGPTDPPATQPPPTVSVPTVTVPPPTVSIPTQTPPTPPTGTSTTPPPPPQDICNGNNYRFVADPTSCYRYYFCFFGWAWPGECDWDRIFVQRFQGCMLGSQQTCERNSNIINVTVYPTRGPSNQ